jgi:hypothetical protein
VNLLLPVGDRLSRVARASRGGTGESGPGDFPLDARSVSGTCVLKGQVMAVADALTLSSMADAVLFMVRWGQTPRPLVASAIKQLQSANAPMAGTVMTRVNLAQQARYGYSNYGYYYGKYKDYYND